jgi:hypothetical protein
MKNNTSDENLSFAVNEILALPKAGKTSGPDHRVTLYSLLSSVTPATSVSETVVQITVPLLSKETHDNATSILATAITPHIVFLFHSEVHISPETLAAIAKEMTNSKPSIRRAFCSLVGRAFWNYGEMTSASSLSFAKAVLPSFEANLKNVTTNPLGSIAGPLEGYIALAILLGPFSRSSLFGMKNAAPLPLALMNNIFCRGFY